MAAAESDLRRGRIIWAEVRDPRGHLKLRPGIIMTPTDEIRADEPLIVMAITTTFPEPAPDDHVELPWFPRGHPVTKLRRRSAAVVTWLDGVNVENVAELCGEVPKKQMELILQKLGD